METFDFVALLVWNVGFGALGGLFVTASFLSEGKWFYPLFPFVHSSLISTWPIMLVLGDQNWFKAFLFYGIGMLVGFLSVAVTFNRNSISP